MFNSFARLVTTTTKNLITTSRKCSVVALRSRKLKSTVNPVKFFVDKFRVRAVGGNGGDGCISFLTAWANENGGPDGGDGGNGGHVVFQSSYDVTNLNHCKSVAEAKHGEKGSTKDCTGKSADHNILKVPIGTVIRTEDGNVLADLEEEGSMFIGARGGAGGKGNAFFKSDVQQAPTHAEYGAIGESIIYILEVKSMAHVGLLGFPNAGKSTLLCAISRARPKVAPYAFTTLRPHIGMVKYSDHEQIAVADLPGLIPGSHKNHGLGIQFLQHTERCCCLMYVVDLSVEKPWDQFKSLQFELSQYSEELVTRPRLIIGNKIDLPESQSNLPKFQKYFKDIKVLPISAKMGTNISDLLKKIREIYDERIK
ncbi:mitochondrial ribosome-associated GTPase 2 isoform X2 [Arctopsyche grandis]|uniref:mitochondrial ribosome-associated GTPase 2 isoform X2 n=1 Tax=Arctopsyche grandis TaxID=121162 RepID=UPI00406D7A0B